MANNIPSNDFLNRYSRQMLVPSIGINNQQVLSNKSIVVIGAGGIGSTLILYLAGAGIGNIKVVDFDLVETSNLHRQIIHNNVNVGINKAISAVQYAKSLNPTINITACEEKFVYSNAIDLIQGYDLCIDCTDNFQARYLINDACVLEGITLISGSAVGLEGQVTVLASKNGPCYRCIHPEPSVAEGCRSCANAGVLGPVPGLIGCLQSVEAIKVLINQSNDNSGLYPLIGKQVFYDASYGEFNTFTLPSKRIQDCSICGENATITSMFESQLNLENSLSNNNSKQSSLELDEKYRIQVSEYDEICKNNINHILLDVRNEIQYHMLSLQRYQQLYEEEVNQGNDVRYIKPVRNSSSIIINIPLSKLLNGQVLQTLLDSNNNNNYNGSSINPNKNSHVVKLISLRNKGDLIKEENNIENTNNNNNVSELPIYVLCRRGVDSILATKLLLSLGFKDIYNINGGITSWKDEVDPSFPCY